MTRLACPACRLRFSRAAMATLTTCPECGQDLETVGSAQATLGFRLFAPTDPRPAVPMAIHPAVPIHGLRPERA
jgi:uncharacterized protein YbaR (Trm112 family)